LTWTIEEALERRGFRFIEVIAPCPTLYSRLNKLGDGLGGMRFYHDNAEIRHGADTRDVGVAFQGKIVCGKFVDEPRPTFFDLMNEHYGEVLGDGYRPMPPEGGMIHEPRPAG
jgi:2-oxoglutarate ferredoxin oxidoreductase subunit beta